MTNPLEELPKEIIMPKIVDGAGNAIAPSGVLPIVMQLAQLGQLVKIRKSLGKAEFKGIVDPRTLSVTERVGVITLIHDFPFTPWITASFFNDGDISKVPPGEVTVYIAINYTFAWIPLNKNDKIDMDFSKSDNRIQFIHYKCEPAKTASVRVVGKY